MIETITLSSRLPIIGGHGDYVSANQPRGAGRQATFDPAAEGLLAERQTLLPAGRRVVDGVSSDYACGLRVRQSVQAIDRRGVPRQVWGSSCVSGSRDTASHDSSKTILGEAAWLQMGRIRHDGQHPKRQQSNFVWLQTLCSRGAVLVCPSIVLEEEVVSAYQRSSTTPQDAEDLFSAVVSTQSQRANRQESETQRSRSGTLGRVQGRTEMQSLWVPTPCSHRLSSRHQRRQEISQQTCHSEKQFEGRNPRSRREVYSVMLQLPSHIALARTQTA